MLRGLHKHGLEEAKGQQWYLPEELLTPVQLGAVASEVRLYVSKMGLYELLNEQRSCKVVMV